MPPETRAGSLETFDDVLALYRRGIAETELPADELTARSLMPPGSAADRDFSSLAPDPTRFPGRSLHRLHGLRERLPDSALYATVIPDSQLSKVTETYFSGVGADPEAADVLARFTATSKYGHQAARRGLEPAKFGLFVDATKCKGCAECVAVCPAGALRMTDKVADAGNGRSTIESAARDMALLSVAAADP